MSIEPSCCTNLLAISAQSVGTALWVGSEAAVATELLGYTWIPGAVAGSFAGFVVPGAWFTCKLVGEKYFGTQRATPEWHPYQVLGGRCCMIPTSLALISPSIGRSLAVTALTCGVGQLGLGAVGLVVRGVHDCYLCIRDRGAALQEESSLVEMPTLPTPLITEELRQPPLESGSPHGEATGDEGRISPPFDYTRYVIRMR